MRTKLRAREGYFERLTGPAATQLSPTAGNTYLVLKAAAAGYAYFEAMYGTYYYPDSTKMLHNTIDSAVNAALASRGDKIIVLEGHTETIAAAAGVDADKIGLIIEGRGSGANKPTLTFTDALSDIDIDAASITIRNMRFIGGVASVAALIDVNAANFTLEDCDFYSGAAGYGVLISVITDAAANDITVRNCTFNYLVATDGTTAITETATEAIRLVGADRAKIEGNYFSGDFTTAAINSVTTASKDVKILNNYVNNIATENIAGGIDLHANTTGFVDENHVYVAYGTSAVALIDPGAAVVGRNWVSNSASESPAMHGGADASDTVASTAVLVSTATSTAASVGIQTSAVASQAASVGIQTSAVASQVDSSWLAISTQLSLIRSKQG